MMSKHVSTGVWTYIRRHERHGRRIMTLSNTQFSRFGKYGRDEDAAKHSHGATISMPVERLRDGDAKVD